MIRIGILFTLGGMFTGCAVSTPIKQQRIAATNCAEGVHSIEYVSGASVQYQKVDKLVSCE